MRRGRRLQQEDQRRLDQGTAACAHGDLAPLSPLDRMEGWPENARTAGRCSERSSARPDARRFRFSALSARRGAAIRFFAGQQGTGGRFRSWQESGILHQQRSVDRVGERLAAATRCDRFQSFVRWESEVFARWKIHRLPYAEAAGLRIGSFPASAVRPRLRHIARADRIRSLSISTRR